MKLAMYKGKGNFYDKLIRFVTLSSYSHCELVIDGLCYSSSPRDGGVRMKYIYLDDNWYTFDLPTHYTKEQALSWFVENAGKKYDWVGAITSIFPFQFHAGNKYFCSEACANMLGLYDPKSYTPQQLLDYFSR